MNRVGRRAGPLARRWTGAASYLPSPHVVNTCQMLYKVIWVSLNRRRSPLLLPAVVGERRECKVNSAVSKPVGACSVCLHFVYLTLEPFSAFPLNYRLRVVR